MAFDMEMIFHSHTNKTHFHKKGCALGLILKVRFLELRGSSLLCVSQNLIRRVCVTLVQQIGNNVDAARRLDKGKAACL